jgi:carboxyl-terminal processing protease
MKNLVTIKIDNMKMNKHSSMFTIAGCIALVVGYSQPIWAQSDLTNADDFRRKTLTTVVANLSQKHVRPKPIDDGFSQVIWKKYLESLDPNKDVFLKSDFQELKKYEKEIDNELKSGSLDFFTAAYQLYQKRLVAAAAGYKRLWQSLWILTKLNLYSLMVVFGVLRITKKD